MFKTLRGRVIATYFLVVLVSLVLASLVFVLFLARYARSEEREELKEQVGAIAEDIRAVRTILPGRPPAQGNSTQPPGAEQDPVRIVKAILDSESEVLNAKLLLVGRDGRVVDESKTRPLFGEQTLQLPEDIWSEEGPRVTEKFFSRLEEDYVFATAPTLIRGDAQGFLLAIKSAEELGSALPSLIWYVVLAGLISLGISMLVALYLSTAISRPIRAVTSAAREMAKGDYRQRVEVKSGVGEMEELAKDFNEMAERVKAAYDMQRDFVGDVSHELRTPLTSIEGFSQAMLDGVVQGEEEMKRSLEIINEESRRLVRVLRDLLLLSQIDAGELAIEKKEVDLVDLLYRLESLYAASAQEKKVDFRVDVPPNSITVNTDKDRLERVLVNLIDNAIKYTEEGGKVVLSASVSAGLASVSVADTGKGIPPDSLPALFERFYRVDKSRSKKHGGAGLGLSICKELIETLGGSITVQSLMGQGTTFTVSLPM